MCNMNCKACNYCTICKEKKKPEFVSWALVLIRCAVIAVSFVAVGSIVFGR